MGGFNWQRYAKSYARPKVIEKTKIFKKKITSEVMIV